MMNAKVRKIIPAIALVILLTSSNSVFAFYNPHIGRWINRDPIEESGFVLNREGHIGRTHDGPLLYGFVLNNPVVKVDALGLMTFEGCDGKEKQIESGLNSFCAKVTGSAFKSCLNHCNIPGRLKWMCDHRDQLTVKCEKDNSGLCKDACGWSLPGGSTIHLCPEQWTNPDCGDVGCTLLHEITHMIGHLFETLPRKVEKCLGCQ